MSSSISFHYPMAAQAQPPSTSAVSLPELGLFAGPALNDGSAYSSHFESRPTPTTSFCYSTWPQYDTAGGSSISPVHPLANTSMGPIGASTLSLPFPRDAYYNAADSYYIPEPQCYPKYKPDWTIPDTSASYIFAAPQSTTTVSYPQSLPMNPPPTREFGADISNRTKCAPRPPTILPRLSNTSKPKNPRKYKCFMCPKFAAYSRVELRRHNVVLGHEPVRHACEAPGCDKTYARMDVMRRHMKICEAALKQRAKPKGAN